MLGLTLEGGGARGAFQMGAIKALYDEGYTFDGVSGTSIGALNGAAIVQGDFELAYNLWKNMDTSHLFDVDHISLQSFKNKKIDKKVLRQFYSQIKDVLRNKGLDTKNITDILDSAIVEEKIRNSNMDFGIVTVSITDLKPLRIYKEDIPKGKMTKYLMASANLPVFRIEPLEGKYYLDGGLYDNCPISMLVEKGYKNIIAIRTTSLGLLRKIDRSVNITYITPSKRLGNLLNFDNKLINEYLRMGYCDAMRMMKKVKGHKYYLVNSYSQEICLSSLMIIPDESINEIGTAMRFDKIEAQRMLFEKILPSLSRKLGLNSYSSYEQIVLGILERLARNRCVEKYKIWDFEDFIHEIKNNNIDKSMDNYNEKVFEIMGKEIIKAFDIIIQNQ